VGDQPSTWHKGGQGADLVIIAPGGFLESVRSLKELRQAQGWSVVMIDVEDLYDEFSFGAKTPYALRDFLVRARRNWKKPPGHLLLAGNASFDPRDHLGLGDPDLVPTKLIDTAYNETASDDWFVDMNGDGQPEMAVGRLPVRTVEEADFLISKIRAYEQAEEGPWRRQALLVADKNGEDDFFIFETASAQVAALLPMDIEVRDIFRSQMDDETARSQLIWGVNEGKLLVNYIGHGSAGVWRGLFSAEDAQGLQNGSRLSLVVAMTCLNGFFQSPYWATLAEALLMAEQGGAVAVWASSGLTSPDGQTAMNKELMRLLFNGEGLTIGEAAMRAKRVVSDSDVRRTWILFGDPTTKLKY
jgi:hypothetical protein